MRQIALTKQTLTSLLNHCSSHPNQLEQIHALTLTTGLSIKNSLITQLLENFIAIENMNYARKLFDEMHKPRTFLWNTIIKAYVKYELPIEALSVYNQMHSLDIKPDPFTYPFLLKACSEIGDVWAGLSLHTHVIKHGMDFVAMVRTELIILYVKFGELGLADFLFETMVDRDLVAWNAFTAACVQMGYASKALTLFRQMGVSGIKPDAFTVVSGFSACGQLGCLEIGENIYEFAREDGIRVDNNIIVENTRLDMYVKCGSIDMAMALFGKMSNKNVVSWSTMIVGYAMNGDSEKALAMFTRMKNEGIRPNYVTYLGVLSACSHVGLVKEGWRYFNIMARSNDETIKPRKEHYACMVDLLGRSGHLEEAYDFILHMPMEPDPGIWGALLGACTIHNNMKLGTPVANILFEVTSDIASYNILLSNMYASAGRWDCVEKVRLKLRKKRIKKVAAYSSVEYNSEVHLFYRGDRSHPQSHSIYGKLEDLLEQIKGMGYVPRINSVLHDVEIEEKEATLNTHSEKLAIAFGLINVQPEFPIRVMKNLRVCEDCHTFAKFVSKITMRDIVMRDKNRFHHFKGGVCSCNDFW